MWLGADQRTGTGRGVNHLCDAYQTTHCLFPSFILYWLTGLRTPGKSSALLGPCMAGEVYTNNALSWQFQCQLSHLTSYPIDIYHCVPYCSTDPFDTLTKVPKGKDMFFSLLYYSTVISTHGNVENGWQYQITGKHVKFLNTEINNHQALKNIL